MKRLILIPLLLLSIITTAQTQTVTVDIKNAAGHVIGSGQIEINTASLCSPCDCSEKVIYCQSDSVDYILLDTAYVKSGEFSISITTQQAKLDGGWIPLFGDLSIGNRILVNADQDKLAMNINGSSLYQNTSLTGYDLTKTTTTKVFRNANDSIYIQIDGGTPAFLAYNTADFKVLWIGRAKNNFEYEGYIHSFDIDGHFFDLSESAGDNISSTDGVLTAKLKTNSTSPNYINDYMWTTPIPSGGAITVINEGAPGETGEQIYNRISTWKNHGQDATIIEFGANDLLNTGGMSSSLTYGQRRNDDMATLADMIQDCKALGQDVYVFSSLPWTTSEIKLLKDFTPYYTTAQIDSMQKKVLEVWNFSVDSVCTAEGAIYLDAWSAYTLGGNPTTLASSWIRNPSNAGGQEDYVHPTNTGQDELAIVAKDAVVDSNYTKIVCVGTSITFGVGATGYPVYLSQKLNN